MCSSNSHIFNAALLASSISSTSARSLAKLYKSFFFFLKKKKSSFNNNKKSFDSLKKKYQERKEKQDKMYYRLREALCLFEQTKGWWLKLETFSWNIRQKEVVVIHLESIFCE
jgi:hypothetical protein